MTIDDRLHRHVDDIDVPPVPMAQIRHDARAARRHRTIAASSAGAVLAVTAAVALGAGVVLPGSDGEPPEPAADQTVVPAGMEVYGVGRLGIVLPEEWSLGRNECGYVEDLTVAATEDPNDCLRTRMSGGPSWATVQFSGGADVVQPASGVTPAAARLTTEAGCDVDSSCWVIAFFDDQSVKVEVGPASPGAETRAARLAEGIQVLEGLAGVPPLTEYGPDAAANYTALAERLGLEVLVQPSAAAPNRVDTVSPRPGTVLPDGSTITYAQP